MPQPIRYSAQNIDLSSRFQSTTTVAASPAAAAETIIATLTLAGFNDLAVVSGIQVVGWAAFTVGTSGVNANLRVRQTNVSGSVIAASGAVTETAANLDEINAQGFDSGAGVAVYVLTLTVGSGSAASTVSACSLRAVIV